MDASNRPHATRKSTARKRHSCEPEQVMDLLRLAQSGDVAAEHELHAVFAPMLTAILARYRDDLWLSEDLPGEGYLILHRLLRQYDASRGVNLFTYLQRTLPHDVWSHVRQRRMIAQRELPLSSLQPEDSEDDCNSTEPEVTLRSMIAEEYGWVQNRSVEQAVVTRVALLEALAALPQRQRKLFEMWSNGTEARVIAADMNISEKACYKALERLLSRLRRVVKEAG
jgi:RNA polymerase sigma factor (sigma-70 family)